MALSYVLSPMVYRESSSEVPINTSTGTNTSEEDVKVCVCVRVCARVCLDIYREQQPFR